MAEQSNPAPGCPRLFCAALPHPRLADPFCYLDENETYHLRKVLRGRVGDPVELLDGQGGLARATIEQFDGRIAICRVQHVDRQAPPSPRVTVATAIPKGPTGEAMADQLSQLGVDRLIPLKTERSVVHPRPQKLGRFEKAAITAAKQSGRRFLMQLEAVTDLSEVVQREADLKLALSAGQRASEPDRSRLRGAANVMLLIGPEGGWSEAELDQLEAAGCERWTIGPHVLRIETAAVAAASITRFLIESEGPA